jgi:hypothetical protein
MNKSVISLVLGGLVECVIPQSIFAQARPYRRERRNHPLPIVNRDVYSLLNLTPGVDQVTSENQLGSPTITTVVNGCERHRIR